MTSQSFFSAYVEAALWSSTDDNGDPLDSTYYESDIAPKALARMQKDCEDFLERADSLLIQIDSDNAQNGHDFWLTRNHHGAGFWGRGYPKPVGNALTELAHSFGGCDLVIGDDGKIYAE